MRQSIINLVRQTWSRVIAPIGRKSPTASRRPRQFAIEHLENRVTPVLGAFDIPVEVDPGGAYDSVAYVGIATGALLTTGRHVLTAGHVGDQNTGPGSGSTAHFRLLDAQGNASSISTPAFERHPHDDDDIAVIELAELAPLTLPGYGIYTNTNELNHAATLVGYGQTGTGTSGIATDIKADDAYPTDTGAGTNYELVRFTVTGNPTGGFFVPRLSDEVPDVLVGVPYNTSAAQLEAALQALPGIGDVQVRLVGDTDFDGDVDNGSHPHAGSYEALFLGAPASDHSMADVVATHNFTGGNNPSIVIQTILQGGSPRVKRAANNYIGEVTDTRLHADFDDGTNTANTLGDGLGQGDNEGFNSGGDSGSPIIISGLIAGVHKGRYEAGVDDIEQTSDFGEVNTYIRVSTYQDFINNVLDDPFDLVLNMDNQPWGNDGIDDTISVTQLGGQLRIHIGGVLRYTEDIDLIQSVTIRGSDDNETITVAALGSIPIQVEGGDGNDTLRASAVSIGSEVTLDGEGDDDTIYAGVDDFDEIRGDVIVHGGAGVDTLYIDDTGDTNQLVGVPDIYNVNASFSSVSFYKPNVWSADVSFDNTIQTVRIDANPDDNAIFVNGTATGVAVSVFGNGGDDAFVVGNGDFDNNLRSSVLVHGGFGDDTLLLDDDNDTGNDEHVLGSDTYSKVNVSPVLTFQFMQHVTLNTAAGNQTVDLNSTEEGVDVTINTQGGEDTVRVHAVHETSNVAINTAGDNDTIEFTPDSRNLSQINGVVTVDAGTGTSDDLILHDDGLTHGLTGSSYTVLAASFDASGFGSLAYSGIEDMELWADQLDDTINIHGLVATVDLTVRGGAGDDLIHVGDGDLDSTIFGDLAIQGGDDNDTLQFNDGADDLGNDSYSFTSNNFSKAFTETWSYLQTENVVLNASAFDNTVQLSSLVPVNLTINAFLGDDTIELGSGRADLIQADIHVNGSLGHNVIHINNQGSPGNRTYTFAGQSFDMTGAFFDELSYTSIDDVVLYAGAANDTIDVQSSVLSTDIEVFGNDGDDSIDVATGDVDSIGGDLALHGGNGSDSVIINDQNDLGNDAYTVTTNQVSKPNFLLLFDGMESLTLNSGADNNTIDINSTLPGTLVAVNAGAGHDTVHLSPLAMHLGQIHGAVTVNGQAGKDQVVAHDEVFALGTANPYTIARTKMGRAGFGGLTFDTIERLQLNLGTGNDTVNITEFNRDTLFALYGNAGADTFNVTTRPSLLDTGGRLFIDGGAPKIKKNSDRLNVYYATKPEVAKKPKVHHKKSALQGAGTIKIEYPAATYGIQYKGVEKVKIAKK